MVEEHENEYRGERLPFQLCEEAWGEIKFVEEEVPGVFYIATQDEENILCRELYAVMPSAVPDIISEEVISYGKSYGDVFLFEYEVEGSGWELVKYELLRYRTRHKLPLETDDSLYEYASFCSDKYPAYFGSPIPPRGTPWGMTIRYKKVFEGAFFLETDKGVWVFALAYSVWTICLSDFTKRLGSPCVCDDVFGVEEAKYLYFNSDTCAPALYELLDVASCEAVLDYITSKEVLEAHLYADFPQYTAWHNMVEQSGWGKGDCLCKLLGLEEDAEIGEELERKDNFIRYNISLASERLLLLP